MPSHTALSKLVERQMRNWEIARSQRLDVPHQDRPRVAPFLALSRRPGSNGSEIAQLVGERLNWPVFDREILNGMAGDDAIRRQIYESMDERDLGWFEEILRAFMQKEFEKNDYFTKLTRTTLSLAMQGSAVFVGRAIDVILPREIGFRVRIVENWEHCAVRYAGMHDKSIEHARNEIESMEADFGEFFKRHFHMEPTDPVRFDLVINTERFEVESTVDLIIEAMHLRGVI